MRYIEPPENFEGRESSLFLAGGISGCPDWQRHVVEKLTDTVLVLLNPRRANFPINDPSAAKQQISWEFEHLRMARAICFWFPCETPCPIALYELGAWSMTDKHLFVGVHPDYQRREDVVVQTALVRPDVKVVESLHTLLGQVQLWASTVPLGTPG